MKTYLLLLFLTTLSFSQVKTPYSDVIKFYDVDKLNYLKSFFDSEQKYRDIRVENFFLSNPQIAKSFHSDERFYSIYDIHDGMPVYFVTDNLGSGTTIRVNHLYSGGSLGLNLHGQNMTGGVWDGGSVRTTHQEFNGKVFSLDAGAINNHATHVAGTFFAAGSNPNLRGIANQAYGLSYDWNNDLSEMTLEAINGLLVSNHSYGPSISSEWLFGAYDSRASQVDQLANTAPFYTIVKSAGNDRNDFTNPIISGQLSAKFGYDLLKGWSNSKNIIVVGAVNDVPNYFGSSSVMMSAFSSWGPTDDGRIKPDIVAKGVNVVSPTSISDTSSGSLQGTSMSSPAVSGACLLLQQHYFNVFSNHMRSSTLRGLINHTADEAGPAIGPDYEFGWGLLNAKTAAELIISKASNNAIIDELTLLSSNTYSRSFSSTGNDALMISISWNDPAATNFNNGIVDPNVSYLVNDLDVRVIKDGEIFYPWTLNPSEAWMPASRNQDNFRDNFEKIQIDNPNGVYQIQVTHKGNLVGGQQVFSLIVSGPNVSLSNDDFAIKSFAIYPNPTFGILNIQLDDELEAEYEIYDIQGRNILNSFIHNGNSEVNVEGLSNGVYLIKVTQGKTTSTKRFIKK